MEADGLEQSQTAQLAEFQGRLAQPGLAPQERAEIEQHQLQMMTVGATRLAQRKAATAQREAEWRYQVGMQQQMRQQLVEALRLLSVPAQNPN